MPNEHPAPFDRWVAGESPAETLLYAAGFNDDMFLVVPSSDALKQTLKLLGKTYARRRLDSP